MTSRTSTLAPIAACLTVVAILSYAAHRDDPAGGGDDCADHCADDNAGGSGSGDLEPDPPPQPRTTTYEQVPVSFTDEKPEKKRTGYTAHPQNHMYFKLTYSGTTPIPPAFTKKYHLDKLIKPSDYDRKYTANNIYSQTNNHAFQNRLDAAQTDLPHRLTVDFKLPSFDNPKWTSFKVPGNESSTEVSVTLLEQQFHDLFVNDNVRTRTGGPERYSLTMDDFKGIYTLDEADTVTGEMGCLSHYTWTKEWTSTQAKNAKNNPKGKPEVQCSIYAAHATSNFVEGVRLLVNEDDTPLQCSDPRADSENGIHCNPKYKTTPQFTNKEKGENYLFYGPNGQELADQESEQTANTWRIQCHIPPKADRRVVKGKCQADPNIKNPLQFYLALPTYPQDSRFSVRSWGDSRWFAVTGAGSGPGQVFGQPITYDGEQVDRQSTWTEYTDYELDQVITRKVWEFPGLTINPT
jgi:hypothetical protein